MALDTQKTRRVQLAGMKPGDLAQVFGLYATVFGAGHQERFAARWEWAHGQNLYPNESPKWVLHDQGRVVGFLAAMPMPYVIGGETLVAHTPCDYMVHPDYRFHGIKLMKEFFATCPNCVTCDEVPATIKVTQWLGAQVVGPVVTYQKVLSGQALQAWRRAPQTPAAVHKLVTWGLQGVDGALMAGRYGSVTLVQEGRFDARFDGFFAALSAGTPATIARGVSVLHWRYGPRSPHRGSTIVTATDNDGEVVGYAVLHLSPNPHPTGYLMDLQTLPERGPAVAAALLKRSVHHFRNAGAYTMKFTTLASQFSPSHSLLRRMGFVVRSRGGRVLLAKLADPRLAGVAGTAANWCYRFGDGENSHYIA